MYHLQVLLSTELQNTIWLSNNKDLLSISFQEYLPTAMGTFLSRGLLTFVFLPRILSWRFKYCLKWYIVSSPCFYFLLSPCQVQPVNGHFCYHSVQGTLSLPCYTPQNSPSLCPLSNSKAMCILLGILAALLFWYQSFCSFPIATVTNYHIISKNRYGAPEWLSRLNS